MAQNRTARRIATIALAVAATTGIGTAVATTSHAAVAPSITNEISAVSTAVTAAYDFATRIANEGGQPEIDACTGGLTKMTSVSKYMGRDYFPIHNECGGAPLLDLVEGSVVYIEGLGKFMVVELLDVMRGDDASVIKNMAGEILLQTCHDSGEGMRVIGLQADAA